MVTMLMKKVHVSHFVSSLGSDFAPVNQVDSPINICKYMHVDVNFCLQLQHQQLSRALVPKTVSSICM